MHEYKICSTYGYFCTSIGSVTLTGDLNKYKYKFCRTYGYFKYKYKLGNSYGRSV